MQFFIHKSVSQVKTENGKKKASFKIIKGKNGEIHQIKGITSNNDPNILNIHENIQKLNKDTGIIKAKHRTFKIKSSDISTLLKNNYEDTTKTVHLKVKKEGLPLKKKMIPIKKEVSPLKKKMIPVKKPVKKEMIPVKKEMIPVKKPVKKEVLPVKKPVKKKISLVKEKASKKDNNKIEKLNKLIKKKKNYLVGGDVNIDLVIQNLNTIINGGYSDDKFIKYLKEKDLFKQVLKDWTKVGDYEYVIKHAMHGQYNVLVRTPGVELSQYSILFKIDD